MSKPDLTHDDDEREVAVGKSLESATNAIPMPWITR